MPPARAGAGTHGLWRGGWYRPARPFASPNFGPRPEGATVDLAVVHSISLPPGVYGGDEVFALFGNTLDCDAHPYFDRLRGMEVSAHFYIRRDGALWQFVDCDARAWHAGRSAWRGRDNCNDDSVGIELEGLEGDRFEPAQYAALAGLCTGLLERYPVRYLAGHSDIAPGRKHDPGPGFDWQRFGALLPAGAFVLPPPPADGKKDPATAGRLPERLPEAKPAAVRAGAGLLPGRPDVSGLCRDSPL